MDAEKNSSDRSDSQTGQARTVSSAPATESQGQGRNGKEDGRSNGFNGISHGDTSLGSTSTTSADSNNNNNNNLYSWPTPDISVENQDYAGFGQLVSQAVDSTSLKDFFKGISDTVVRSLYPANPSDAPKNIKKLKLFIKDMDGVAHCTDLNQDGCKEIHLSTRHCKNIFEGSGKSKDRLLQEVHGVLFHEMVHVWQYDGKAAGSPAPHGIIEGIADYFRLRANLSPPHWSRRRGGSWENGYETSAFFLAWIEDGPINCKDFVCKLNLMLATGGGGWRQDLFEELTGEGLQELWSRYQNFLPKEEGEEQEEEVLYDSDFSQVGEQSGNKKSMNVKYHFRNPTSENPGSLLFTECVPSPVELLKALSERVVKILYAAPPSHYPYFVSSITLILREFDGVAHCQGSKTTKELHLSSSYILDFFKRNNSDKKLLEAELHGILVHELTHCWQWSEKVKQKNISTVVAYEKKPAPGGVIEGVADFSRLSCSLQPAHWKRKKDGSWDEGYATTAYFFDFIQQKMQQHNFVRKLNYMIGLSGWSVVIFKQLTGKTVEELWRLYQQDRD